MSRRSYLTHLQEYSDRKEINPRFGKERSIMTTAVPHRFIRRENNVCDNGNHYHQTRPSR